MIKSNIFSNTIGRKMPVLMVTGESDRGSVIAHFKSYNAHTGEYIGTYVNPPSMIGDKAIVSRAVMDKLDVFTDRLEISNA